MRKETIQIISYVSECTKCPYHKRVRLDGEPPHNKSFCKKSEKIIETPPDEIPKWCRFRKENFEPAR